MRNNETLKKKAAKALALLGFYKAKDGLWHHRDYPVKVRGCSWWGNVAITDKQGEHLTAINYLNLSHEELKRICGRIAGRDCGDSLKGNKRVGE